MPIGILFVIIIALSVVNLRGNYFLSGWDNLHPEFNFSENIKRAFFAGWQEYQGVGLPTGNAHATDLIRSIVLWLLSSFIPMMFIRKMFFSLMLLLGPIGVYFLTYLLLKIPPVKMRRNISLMASFFYLFSFATVQFFYTPYEAFASHYAFLPWLIASLYFFIQSPSKKRLLIFFTIQVVGSIQFYIPTLFLVYFFIVSLILISHLFSNRSFRSIKTVLLALLIILGTNLYWLFPFIYYLMNNLSSQFESAVNLLYTDEIYQLNRKMGTLHNIIFMKGYLFDYIGTSLTNKTLYVMEPWRKAFNNWYSFPLAISFFVFIIVGCFQTITRKKNRIYVILFIVFFSLIAINTPPFSVLDSLLRKNTIFHQIFRNPFTKFANSLLLFESILFAFGLHKILSIRFIRTIKFSGAILFVLIAVGLNVLFLPAWKGHFFYNRMRVTVPESYFDLFSFFNNQPSGRIANLPQFNQNSWYSYQWGYTGSGFIWYGLPQPVMDRSFDVWNKDNENYYWEISEALYSQNLNQIESVFDKYGINWIISDNSFMASQTKLQMYIQKTEELFKQSSRIKLEKTFGAIKIYRFQLNYPLKNYISIKSQLPLVQPVYQWTNKDAAYSTYGNYLSTQEKSPSPQKEIYYPFRTLLSNRKTDEFLFSVEETDFYYAFKQTVPKRFLRSALVLPPLSKTDIINFEPETFNQKSDIRSDIFLNGEFIASSSAEKSIVVPISPTYENPTLEIRVPKLKGIYSKIVEPDQIDISGPPISCNQMNTGFMTRSYQENAVELNSRQSNNCLQFPFSYFYQQNAYLVSIQNQNISGRPLFAGIYNDVTKRTEIEVYLSKKSELNTAYLIIPPREQYGLGYNLNLDNISVNSEHSINRIGQISIFPIPYNFLTNVQFVKQNGALIAEAPVTSFSTTHPHYDFYTVTFDNPETISDSYFLLLSQSFHSGWKAYSVPRSFPLNHSIIQIVVPFFGKPLINHVLINNWMNGWELNEKSDTVVILYLPQYLQYFGFGLLIFTFIGIVFWKTKKTKLHS